MVSGLVKLGILKGDVDELTLRTPIVLSLCMALATG